jgi:hypothetical protein
MGWKIQAMGKINHYLDAVAQVSSSCFLQNTLPPLVESFRNLFEL